MKVRFILPNKMKVISGKKFEKQSTLDELKQGMNSFGGQQTILKEKLEF